MPEHECKSAARQQPFLGASLVALLLAPFAFRVFLIQKFPGLYSWDAFTRLWDAKSLVVRHWLPVPQIPVLIAEALDWNTFAIRVTYAAIAVLGSAALGWFVFKQTNRACGMAAFALVSMLPVFMVFSISPYQEGCLVLFLFGFLCTRELDPEAHPWRRWLEPSLLACACLCRYEAWVFAGIVAIKPMIERRWKDLLPLVPAAIVAALWLVLLPYLDTSNPVAHPDSTSGIQKLLGVSSRNVSEVFDFYMWELMPLGLAMGLLGVIVALHKGGLLGREFLAFGAVICGLAVMRSASSPVTTSRMSLLVSICTATYISIGLVWLTTQVRPSWRRPLFLCLLACLLYPMPFKGYYTVKGNDQIFQQEREAGELLVGQLEQSPPGTRVGVIPRKTRNQWNESMLKPIFATSTKLDPENPQWVFDEETIRRDVHALDYLLWYHYAKRRYEVVDTRLLRTHRVANRSESPES